MKVNLKLSIYSILNNKILSIINILINSVIFSSALIFSIISFSVLRINASSFLIIFVYVILMFLLWAIIATDVFNIHILNFIRKEDFYIKLKAIGADDKQIVRSVYIENYLLFLISYILSFLIVNVGLKKITNIFSQFTILRDVMKTIDFIIYIFIYLIFSLIYIIVIFISSNNASRKTNYIRAVDLDEEKEEHNLFYNSYILKTLKLNILTEYLFLNIKKRKKDIKIVIMLMTIFYSLLTISYNLTKIVVHMNIEYVIVLKYLNLLMIFICSVGMIFNLFIFIFGMTQYRSKDLKLLRLLGIEKNKITRIVFYEILYYYLKCILIGFILANMIVFLIKKSIEFNIKSLLFNYNVPYVYGIVSIIVIFVFIYAITRVSTKKYKKLCMKS